MRAISLLPASSVLPPKFVALATDAGDLQATENTRLVSQRFAYELLNQDTGRTTRVRSQAGFTLLEMLVVIALLGLVLGIVLQRGPVRSPALELRATGGEVARTLRQARARAVATNQVVSTRFDVPGHAYEVDGGEHRLLPASLSIRFTSVAPGAQPGGLPAIGFAPDGSSSGGLIVFGEGTRMITVSVDWLTGRVGVSAVRSTDAG